MHTQRRLYIYNEKQMKTKKKQDIRLTEYNESSTKIEERERKKIT